MSFQTSKAFEHVDKLAYEIGPRLAGSRGEEMAAEYIKQVMSSYGLKVNVQEFKFVDRGLKKRAGSLLMASALTITFFVSPIWALVAWVVAFFGRWLLPLLLPKKRSRNVIGTIGSVDSDKTIVITAHYDSARCKISRGGVLSVLIYPLLLLFTLFLILRFFVSDVWRFLWVVSALPLMFMFGLTYVSGSIRKISPGANDNAAGVAVMLEAARYVSENAPKDTRVIFVATGAEEQGLKGAEKLSTSGTIRKEALILNLDGVGFGSHPYFIEGNGLLRRTRTSSTINQRLFELGRKLNLVVKPWWAARAKHDHIPLVKKGYLATTLTFDSPEENPDKLGRMFGLTNARQRNYQLIHTMDDLPDKLKPKTVEKVGSFLLEFLKGGW